MGTKHKLSAYISNQNERVVYCVNCGNHDPHLDGDCFQKERIIAHRLLLTTKAEFSRVEALEYNPMRIETN